MSTSVTARFQKRKNELGKIFNTKSLTNVWRDIVRKQLRTADIKDLYDYYDFNYNIEIISKQLREEILTGKYKPDAPLFYKLEKKFAICRHLTIPSPSDSLILQTIVEHLSSQLKEKAPSKQALYSRDKHNLKLPHEMESGYPWFILWKKYQKEIYKFSKDYSYLVVTDIANYYDNIDLRELRAVISEKLSIDEVVLDFLFNLIQELMWVPDYLPKRTRGLPTINQECVRFLAHVFLFEIDEVLKDKTNDNFVRWLDDINLGVETKQDGKLILSALNDVLKSRSLALNLSKTLIYTSDEAEENYLFNENVYLSEFTIAKPGDHQYPQTTLEIESSFKKHLNKSHLKNWSKVTKRYFTIASKLQTRRLLKYSFDLFQDYPDIRPKILFYISSLGFKKRSAEILHNILDNVNYYDDITLFNLVQVITEWIIPKTKTGYSYIKVFDRKLQGYESRFDLYCYLWFSAKYLPQNKLLSLIHNTKDKWLYDSFLSRQIASLLPRIYNFRRIKHDELSHMILATGLKSPTSIIINQRDLRQLEKLNNRLNLYLFPQHRPKTYPLYKLLILTNLLHSEAIRNNKDYMNKIREHVVDPWHLDIIKGTQSLT